MLIRPRSRPARFLLTLLVTAGCNRDPGADAGTRADLHQPDQVDAAAPDLGCPEEASGVAGNQRLFCGDTQCPADRPLCCRPAAGKPFQCAATRCGCVAWLACIDSNECPADHPYCCIDDRDHRECRAQCTFAACSPSSGGQECPADRPTCRAAPDCCSIECAGFGTCSSCRSTCPACGPDEVCSTVMVECFDISAATCLKKCDPKVGCPAGLHCVAFRFSNSPTVCVSDSVPPRCTDLPSAPPRSCSARPARCFDERTLTRSFESKENWICAEELTDCAGGCEPESGVTPAHCR